MPKPTSKAEIISCPLCNSHSSFELASRDLMFKKSKLYNYYVCNFCNLSFIHPMPSLDDIKSFYPDSYMIFEPAKIKKLKYFEKLKLKYKHGYKELLEDNSMNYLLSLFTIYSHENIDFIKNGKFLDIGCGNGSRLLKMKQLGWDVSGVEMSKKAYNECKKNGLNVFNSTLENTSFESNSFDVIYLSHLIEHLPNPIEVLTIVKKILKPNGLLYIKTPNRESLGRKLFKRFWYANDVPRHLSLFGKKNLTMVSKKLRFDLVHYSEDTTPKIFLNSLDYVFNLKKPSKKNKFLRLISKIYVYPAKLLRMGDESFYIFKKIKN